MLLRASPVYVALIQLATIPFITFTHSSVTVTSRSTEAALCARVLVLRFGGVRGKLCGHRGLQRRVQRVRDEERARRVQEHRAAAQRARVLGVERARHEGATEPGHQ